MKEETVRITKKDRVAFITFHGRTELNLLGEETVRRLGAAFKEVEADTDTRVVVLQSYGEKAFNAGVDVRMFKEFSPLKTHGFIHSLHLAMRNIMECPFPVIASIKGACVGGSLEIITACDMRIASEDAFFGLPEIKVGIPSVIEASLLPRYIGWGRAAEIILTGDSIDAREAFRVGLVNRVVPRRKLPEETLKAAGRFLGLSPLALRVQKDIMKNWLEMGHEAGAEYSMKALSLCFSTGHPREAMEAFLQKREPQFGEIKELQPEKKVRGKGR